MTNQSEVALPSIDASTTTTQEMFAQILHARIQGGAMECAIEKQVDKLIEETASDVFRSYNDVGKALKDAMSKSIMPQLESIGDLPDYHHFVMSRIKLAAQNFYDTRLAQAVDAELKEVFSEVPEQITLSWLIDKLIDDAKSDSGDYEDSITLIMEDKVHDWTWSKPGETIMLYLDKESGNSERNCEFCLHLSKDKNTGKYSILSLRINGEETKNRLTVGRFYNYEKILFNLYSMKGQIDLDKGLDSDDYETSYERENECHCD